MTTDLDLGRRSIVDWAESAPDKAGAEFVPAQEKFLVETPIGKGGMGEVFLVTDQDLRRQVAMKILRPDMGGRESRLHFVAEAQATSQLEHPGIPPVHDIGVTGDGRPYFTMKLVRGRTLAEVLHDLVLKRREVQREYTLHRLVTIAERIAETLHFAHERGVIHRDLKPENVMLGDYGEVHLMDWGLAHVQGEAAEYEQVETARTEAGLETQLGEIKGTPPYMSPEQALAETLDGRTDIYALGCVLYEMLTLHSAFDPHDKRLLVRVQAGRYPDVATRDPRRPVPEPLADICRRAMATDREERYASARELGEALRAWLDGRSERERRHKEAEKLAGQGQEAAAKYGRLHQEVDEAEKAAEAEAAKYKPHQPVPEKRSMIEARQRVETLQTEVALAFAETTHLLNAALMQEADNATARGTLARLWQRRLADAERRGDPADVARTLTMVRRYDDGTLQAFVKGDGSLTFASDPPGAEVWLYRYVEHDGVLGPEEERHLGQTPLGPVILPMGSYLCILKKEGFRDVRYPVHISRNRTWQGEVKLRTDAEIGEGFVFVPAGPFVYGAGKDTEIKELPDFAIARHPVTFGEYAAFLEALDGTEAQERLPFMRGEGPLMERGADGQYRPLPTIVEAKARAWCLERYGEGFEANVPVLCVSWHDAVAYCAWKTETTGKDWRLPTEEEREKATRGVDGRRFPWGDLEDASLGKCRESREVNPQPEPVGAFPMAESVYGVGDAAGGVWDWTDSWFDERKSLRVLRGGAWSLQPEIMRCAYRYGNGPTIRAADYGFRCARGL
ncbi:MAG: SUMF1/EgtB/PvdO family nonheme iron enzyme [Planctomycetota bacterium]|jgi:serine/threonine-protein kinase